MYILNQSTVISPGLTNEQLQLGLERMKKYITLKQSTQNKLAPSLKYYRDVVKTGTK